MEATASARKKKFPTPPPIDGPDLLDDIVHNGTYAAVILLVSAVLAMICANSSTVLFGGKTVSELYFWLWHLELGAAVHTISVTQALHLWINDGLMVFFFFLVGLEIKRELLVGELATVRKAALPIGAAVGGMICPALLYALFNFGTEGIPGWGIPMATDIAFAVGVLGLLSGRVPFALNVFLMALAIVDDLGAVVVIAVFYTQTIAAGQLFVGLSLITVSFLLSKLGVRSSPLYALLFGLVWVTFLQSGVHATIAGVLFAFTVPIDARYQTSLFTSRVRALLNKFDDADEIADPLQVNATQQHYVARVEAECRHVEPPLQRLERQLLPFSAFLIMPLFAFSNAGVKVNLDDLFTLMTSRVTLGVFFGLFIGKQLGIFGFAWAMVRLGWSELPRGVTWKQLYGAALLGGIGFTMSLFITELAFSPTAVHGNEVHAALKVEPMNAHSAGAHTSSDDPVAAARARHNDEAKFGVLAGSLVAGVVGTLVLYRVTSPGGGTSGPGHGESHHA